MRQRVEAVSHETRFRTDETKEGETPNRIASARPFRDFLGVLSQASRKSIDPATRKLRRAWVFTMVLDYSRHRFARIVFDQRAETWVRLHIEAFV